MEPIPGVIGQEAGYIRDRFITGLAYTDKQLHTLTVTPTGHLKSKEIPFFSEMYRQMSIFCP